MHNQNQAHRTVLYDVLDSDLSNKSLLLKFTQHSQKWDNDQWLIFKSFTVEDITNSKKAPEQEVYLKYHKGHYQTWDDDHHRIEWVGEKSQPLPQQKCYEIIFKMFQAFQYNRENSVLKLEL